MIKGFITLALLTLAVNAHGAITLGGEADSHTMSSTTGSVTISPTAGSLVTVICIGRNGASSSISVSDNRSQSYSAVQSMTQDGASDVYIAYAQNVAAGSTTITCSGANDTWLVHAAYWPGAHTTAAFVEADSINNAWVTSHPAGDVGVDASAGGLIISACGQSSTVTGETVATHYTALTLATGGNNRQWWQYRLASGALTNETAPFAASNHSSNCQIASFAPAAGNVAIVTYDTPNLWVDGSNPSCSDSYTKASVTASLPWCTLGRAVWGSTSRSSPNASQAAAAGDVVQVAAGTYITAGVGSSDIAYNPANAGTQSNPIVFQRAPGATVTLNLSSQGSAIGGFNEQWITWRGFTLDDDANPQFIADGVVHVESSTGITLEDLTIKGRDEDTLDGDQYCGIFWSDVQDLTIRGNYIIGFGGGLDGSGLDGSDENHSAFTGYYRSQNVLIEHNECLYNGTCYYHKGIHLGGSAPYETGPVTFRYNYAHDNRRGIRQYVANHSSNAPALFYQNVISNNSWTGIQSLWLGNDDGDPGECCESKYVKFVNNTLYNNGTPSGEGAQIFFSQYPAGRYIEFHNNIIAGGGEWGYFNYGTTIETNATILDRQLINGVATFGYINSTNQSLSGWQSATGQDANTITSAPTFVNAAAGNFHLVSNGQAALTLGRVVFGIGGTNGNTIPAGAYITGNETIGRQ